jgi:hypothetical protein
MQKKARFVGVVGHIEPDWIKKQIQLEDNIAFAKSAHYVPKASATSISFDLSETARFVFARSITKFVSSMMP